MDIQLLDLLNILLRGKVELRNLDEFADLESRTLLELLDKCPDPLLPILIRILRESPHSTGVFQKLMGEHEEENRPLVDRFFQRYMNMMVEDADQDYNPLLAYLDPTIFQDIALIQTRENFFKAQTMVHIQEFLETHFEGVPQFEVGEQDHAWNFFFQELLKI